MSCVFSQRDNNMEILCKAATIAQECQSCHKYFKGIYDNLLGLVRANRARHKVRHNSPCTAYSTQASSLVTIFVLLFPITVNSPTQAAERNSTPASFLRAPFSHSRGHVLQHQEAPSHWRISSRNYAKSYKKSIRVRSEETTSFVFKLAPYFSNIIYNSLNKCIFGLNVLALHRMLYKATVKRVLSLWEQAYVARNCQTICPAMELSSC